MKTTLKRFWGMLCLAAVGALFLYSAVDVFRALASSLEAELCWVKTPCVLQHAARQEHKARRGSYQTLCLSYSYGYGGTEYQGERYDFWNRHFDKAGVEKEARRLAEESALSCYVNPENPQESVIDCRVDWWGVAFRGLLAAVFFLLCFWGLVRQVSLLLCQRGRR